MTNTSAFPSFPAQPITVVLCGVGGQGTITAADLLARAAMEEGYEVKATDFLKIGVPFTLLAVLTGYLYCWFVWA